MCKRLLSKLVLLVISLILILPNGYAQSLPDPTRPQGAKTHSSNTKVKRVKGWYLSSTLIANGRRNAIINGKLVTIGQTVNKARVISIHANEVWLKNKQKRFRIKLLQRSIKDFSQSADK